MLHLPHCASCAPRWNSVYIHPICLQKIVLYLSKYYQNIRGLIGPKEGYIHTPQGKHSPATHLKGARTMDYTTYRNEELIDLIRSGDEAAYEQLFRNIRPITLHEAAMYRGKMETYDTEDFIQEGNIVAWEIISRGNYSGTRTLRQLLRIGNPQSPDPHLAGLHVEEHDLHRRV